MAACTQPGTKQTDQTCQDTQQNKANHQGYKAAPDSQHATAHRVIASIGIRGNQFENISDKRTDNSADKAADKGPAAMNGHSPDNQTADKVDQRADDNA